MQDIQHCEQRYAHRNLSIGSIHRLDFGRILYSYIIPLLLTCLSWNGSPICMTGPVSFHLYFYLEFVLTFHTNSCFHQRTLVFLSSNISCQWHSLLRESKLGLHQQSDRILHDVQLHFRKSQQHAISMVLLPRCNGVRSRNVDNFHFASSAIQSPQH